MGESNWCAWKYGMAAHYAAKHPHQSVEDGQPFEMGPKEVKHMQKVAMSVHAPEGLDRLGLNPNSTVKHLGFPFCL